MGHKKREKIGIDHTHKRKGSFAGTKMLLGLFALLIIGGIGYWQLTSNMSGASSPTSGSSEPYPQNVAATIYSDAVISANGYNTSLPVSVVKSNKLTFMDLKLQIPLDELSYQGRTIPLSLYKGGQYLPLLVISTPSGKTVAGLRVCEPCGSFSFHIVNAKYLDCDACHTKWNIETLTGVSGGCPSYPPPKLPISVASDITIDLSPLDVQVTS